MSREAAEEVVEQMAQDQQAVSVQRSRSGSGSSRTLAERSQGTQQNSPDVDVENQAGSKKEAETEKKPTTSQEPDPFLITATHPFLASNPKLNPQTWNVACVAHYQSSPS